MKTGVANGVASRLDTEHDEGYEDRSMKTGYDDKVSQLMSQLVSKLVSLTPRCLRDESLSSAYPALQDNETANSYHTEAGTVSALPW